MMRNRLSWIAAPRAARLQLLASCLLLPTASAAAQDRAWYDTTTTTRPAPVQWTRRSLHIPMRDGVRIAVDVYLPGGPSPAAPLPTILHQTRYRRGLQLKDSTREANAGPPFGLMSFLQAGYAVVITDVRGTGASFGSRITEFSPAEVRDGWDVLDWIVAQSWSDGNVGSTGISYPGTTAELIGTLGHPALKAVAPLFSIYDFYDDVIRPGGLFLDTFFRQWAALVRGMDNNTFDPPTGAVTGVRPVDGPNGGPLLAAAIAEHQRNASIYGQAQALETRDDRDATGLSLEEISPHRLYDTLSRRIPIYNYGGWADGFSGAQIKRFLAQPSPGSRLIMGPWNHGGGWSYYPGKPPARSQFDQQRELLRFFDYHLRGMSTGIEREPPVWYFTTGEDRWKSAAAWPVNTRDTTFRVHGRRLSDQAPSPEALRYVHVLYFDSTTGTGNQSRWNTILGGGAVSYVPRPRGANGHTAWESEPLSADLIITGHPVVTLTAMVPRSATGIFVYLEEVDSAGMGHLVTEGQLDLRHGKVSPAPSGHLRPEAFHSYKRADTTAARSAISTAVELLPMSHRFTRGNRIRLVITRADKDHFPVPSGPQPELTMSEIAVKLPVER
jgi:putative CocE/NonD family hydrolase